MGARTVGSCWTFSRLNKVEVGGGGKRAFLPFKRFAWCCGKEVLIILPMMPSALWLSKLSIGNCRKLFNDFRSRDEASTTTFSSFPNSAYISTP